MREVDVARPVVELLREEGWDVYQEVHARAPTSTRGFRTWVDRTADIVATRGPLLIVVEVKVSLTFEVIGQAAQWLPVAHRVYVAAPCRHLPHPMARHLLESLGVGMFAVDEGRHVGAPRAALVVDASTRARADVTSMRKCLHEEQKTYSEAGNAGASRWSPFKRTCRDVAAFVEANPGCTLKELIEGVETHYRKKSNAASSIAYWVHRRKVPGVVADKGARHIRLWPEGNEPRTGVRRRIKR